MTYNVNTIIASRSLEFSSKSTPALLALGRSALLNQAPTLAVTSAVLEGAISELSRMAYPTARALLAQLASVK